MDIDNDQHVNINIHSRDFLVENKKNQTNMKKWHSGLQSEEILNPALYKQHQMKTRWSSNSLVQRGRSGALSVTLSAALMVRGKPLNEVRSEES